MEQESGKTEMSEVPISVLEEKYMMQILLFLAENGVCKKTDIYGAVSRNLRLPLKLDMLEAAGLLTQTPSEHGRRCDVEITEDGRRVTELISEIAGILGRNLNKD